MSDKRFTMIMNIKPKSVIPVSKSNIQINSALKRPSFRKIDTSKHIQTRGGGCGCGK